MNNWLIILFRVMILFIITLVLTRIMGKKSLSKVNPFHFICYVIIAIIAALISLNIITNMYLGLIALIGWCLLPIALDYLCMKNKMIHNLVNGKESILIKNGKVMEENLGKARMTGEELLQALRSKKVFNLADVEFAIMEIDGDINIGLKSEKKQKVFSKVEPQTVILDGNIINESLTNMGLNQSWLNVQLQVKGVSLDNVFIGQVDSSGDLYLDLFDDNIQIPETKVKEMLYANLEKSQADLMSFALETKNQRAKEMYSKDAERLKVVIEKLKPYLLK
jgi:uncharacterized membrane protein YcaP (DUF421 family)